MNASSESGLWATVISRTSAGLPVVIFWVSDTAIVVENSWVWPVRYRPYGTRLPSLDATQDLRPGLTSFAPSGLLSQIDCFPRLSPWAVFIRRFAAFSWLILRAYVRAYAPLPLPKRCQRVATAAANIIFITSAAMNQ